MRSFFLLLAEFETADVPLELVAQKYFGHSPDQARRKAAAGAYPFRCVRYGSQKSDYLVPLEELARWRDQKIQQTT